MCFLADYFEGAIIKEMMQNAEDAKASSITASFCYSFFLIELRVQNFVGQTVAQKNKADP